MNRADLEHYEARLVLTAAQGMLPKGTTWDSLSHQAKQKYLDRAVGALCAVINDPECLKRLGLLARQAAEKAAEKAASDATGNG